MTDTRMCTPIGWDNFNEGTCLRQCVSATKKLIIVIPKVYRLDELFSNKREQRIFERNWVSGLRVKRWLAYKMEANQKKKDQKRNGAAQTH